MSGSLIPVGSVVLQSPVPTGESDQDLAFIQQAFLSNLAELEEANLASARATDPAVREFASWMISDHTAAIGALAFIAQQLGVSLPTTLTTQQQAELNSLTSVPAQSFD